MKVNPLDLGCCLLCKIKHFILRAPSSSPGLEGLLFMEEKTLGTKWKERAFEEQLKSCAAHVARDL